MTSPVFVESTGKAALMNEISDKWAYYVKDVRNGQLKIVSSDQWLPVEYSGTMTVLRKDTMESLGIYKVLGIKHNNNIVGNIPSRKVDHWRH